MLTIVQFRDLYKRYLSQWESDSSPIDDLTIQRALDTAWDTIISLTKGIVDPETESTILDELQGHLALIYIANLLGDNSSDYIEAVAQRSDMLIQGIINRRIKIPQQKVTFYVWQGEDDLR